jgi:hypothetical protein
MKYIQRYWQKDKFEIFVQDEYETKLVLQGLSSPKVIAWLEQGNVLEIIPFVEPDLSEVKAQRIQEFKNNANAELSTTDYIVIRHYEQTLLNIPQTLTNDEFILLCEQRQAIRDKSNSLEVQINSMNNYEEIIAVNW